MRARVTQRRYWHIVDVPLVVNEWSPETALDPPELSALPMWIDLKGVPSLMFSYKGLKCLSRATGKLVKLRPNTEKCTRLDVARVLVEVNLHNPLVEKISFLDGAGEKVMIDVSYPWVPPKCKVCNSWGHKGVSCTSKKVQVLQKDKETEEEVENAGVEINGDGKVRYELNPNRNIVSEMLLELEGLPPALGCGVVGDTSRKYFEIGETSNSITENTEANLDWALVGCKSPRSSSSVKDSRVEEVLNEESLGEKEVVISPSRFSVLKIEDTGEVEKSEDDEAEEGEVIADEQKQDAKQKESSKNARLLLGSNFKLCKQVPARSKDLKAPRTNTYPKKASSRKL